MWNNRNDQRGEYATLDDENAVDKVKPRHMGVQEYSYTATLPKEMVRFLNLDEQSSLYDARLVKGIEPVLVEEPAIVLRPFTGDIGGRR